MTFQLTSPAFQNGESIPPPYTCDGKDVSPPLAWSGVPAGTNSLALIVNDPDAPDPAAPTMVWDHWVLYNLPPATRSLAENIREADLPGGTLQGVNDWKRTGYGGPCPPIGRHRYFFRLYALDRELPDLDEPTGPQLKQAVDDYLLATATLMGSYAHPAQADVSRS
ncbi:MAG: YbhB/YbcL family Raf kinase inhibitor-like protein [Woeseiaceae bacterium]